MVVPDNRQFNIRTANMKISPLLFCFWLTAAAAYVFPEGYASASYCNLQLVPAEYVTLPTLNGKVRGLALKTSGKRTPYWSFIGIPFAKPPIGELRFKEPQPVDPWTGTQDAIAMAPSCPQSNVTFMSEDCLTLNVYVPQTESENTGPKSVMVFFHGGAFQSGSGSPYIYGPDEFCDNDVISVFPNYRVGPFGFMSWGNKDYPGNAGLKDQSLALKWVKDNIAYFGGDPSKITIFGQSAGAASVAFHMLSPLSRGNFNQAICQSGNVIAPWSYLRREKVVEHTKRLSQKLGCLIPDIRCLLKADVKEILEKREIFDPIALYGLNLFAYLPTDEPDHPGAFMTKPPREYLENGEFDTNTRLLAGLTTNEALYFEQQIAKLGDLALRAVGVDLTIFCPQELGMSRNWLYKPVVHRRISQEYFNGEPLCLETLPKLIKLLSVIQFDLPHQEFLSLVARHSKENIFNYQFSYSGARNAFCVPTNTVGRGTAHTDDLGYLFNICDFQKIPNNITAKDDEISELMIKSWTSFAKYGSPTLPDTSKVTWESYSASKQTCLDIDSETTLKEKISYKTNKFWNDIFQMVKGIRPYPE